MATKKIQMRQDTAANWAAANPVLSLGEMGIDITKQNFKIGNGVNAWGDLSYQGIKTIKQNDAVPMPAINEPILSSQVTNWLGNVFVIEIENAYPLGGVIWARCLQSCTIGTLDFIQGEEYRVVDGGVTHNGEKIVAGFQIWDDGNGGFTAGEITLSNNGKTLIINDDAANAANFELHCVISYADY